MTVKKILPLFLLFITTYSSAQIENDSLLFRGVIMEGDSLFSLPYAKYELNNKGGYTANEEGQFAFWAKNGDIVHFSYVGFKPLHVQIHDSLSNSNYLIGIFLSRDTIELSEIVIIPQITNGNALARNFPLSNSQDNISAQQNIARSTYQAKTQPITKWDAEMNQKNFIQARSNDIAYKQQIQPNHMIGIGNVAIHREVDRLKLKNTKQPKHQHISLSEWKYLILSYQEKIKLKTNQNVK